MLSTNKIGNVSFERRGEWIKCGVLLKNKGYFLHLDSIPMVPCICKPFEEQYIEGDIYSGDTRIGFIYTETLEKPLGDSSHCVIVFHSVPTGAGKQFGIKDGV